VLGDGRLLERLVANLIDNAIKHNTPDGWINAATGSDDGSSYLTVANSGAVIPADAIPSLFQPFHRLDERTNASNGVGIGLAIVQAVATTHHGHIDASARPDGGLNFTVTFPTTSEAADRSRDGPEVTL
jgi:signal transduction histidine kinase